MSTPVPITVNAAEMDFSSRWVVSTTVVASPADNTETIIASVIIPDNVQIFTGVRVTGWAAFTVGTSGVSANLKVRRTNVSGTTVAATGATTVAATDLVERSIVCLDTAVPAGTIYKLTLTIGSGAAASTVSAVFLDAMPI